MSDKEKILHELSQPLDPSRVASRQGAGGRSLSYLESYDVINRLNAIFGFDGWSDELISFEPVGDPARPSMFRAGVELVALIGDTWIKHSDIGVGVVNGTDWKPENVEKAVKEAVSDAMKRAARKYGDQFGNCLYDKHAPEHAGANGGQPRPQAPQRPQQARSAAPAAQNGHAQGDDPRCPKCGGYMWDNREKKAKGEMADNRPDFSCKKKTDPNCKGAIWPPRDGDAPQRPAPRQAQPQDDGPPPALADVWAEDEARANTMSNTAYR